MPWMRIIAAIGIKGCFDTWVRVRVVIIVGSGSEMKGILRHKAGSVLIVHATMSDTQCGSSNGSKQIGLCQSGK